MRLLLARIPPETKVAAVVLGAALLQVGLLAWLGLRTTEQRRAELERDMEDRAARAISVVVTAGKARIKVFEQDAQREIEPDARKVAERVGPALARAPVFHAGFVVSLDDHDVPVLHEQSRMPLAPAERKPRDDAARAAVADLEATAVADPEGVLARCEAVADSTTDLVARALALQVGWRTALRLGRDSQALTLARRVLEADLRSVSDDRGLEGETAPFGLGAAAVVCEIWRRACERGGVDDAPAYASAFVLAVSDRRVQAQRMRDLLEPAAYAVERDQCRALADDRVMRVSIPKHRLDALRVTLDECDTIDANLDLARSVDATALGRTVREHGAERLAVDGGMLTVLPLRADDEDGAERDVAVALLASHVALQDALLEPARQGVDLPEGVELVIHGRDGVVIDGDEAAETLTTSQAFRGVVPGLTLTLSAALADPGVLDRKTESARTLWLWILGAALLAVVSASLLAVRAVMRQVRLARLKGDFVSNLSHELRTPLTSLRMFVETLQEDRVTDPAERRQCLDFIAQETDRLAALVDRILQFAAFSRGRAPIELRSTSVAAIVTRALEIFRSRSEPAGARIDVQIASDVPEALLDRDAMIQVILNLLDNSVKYGGESGTAIRVVVRGKGPRVRIEVEDDGPGVPERERELVFEEFYRGDDSLSSSVQGAGIGLALCRRIVLAHGGRIDVSEGRTLGGACFAVTLPEAAVGRRLAVAAQEDRR